MLKVSQVNQNKSRFQFRTLLSNPYPNIIQAFITSNRIDDINLAYRELNNCAELNVKPIYTYFCPISEELYYQFIIEGDQPQVEYCLDYYFHQDNNLNDNYNYQVYDFELNISSTTGFDLNLHTLTNVYDSFISQMTHSVGNRSGGVLSFQNLNYIQVINVLNCLYKANLIDREVHILALDTLKSLYSANYPCTYAEG